MVAKGPGGMWSRSHSFMADQTSKRANTYLLSKLNMRMCLKTYRWGKAGDSPVIIGKRLCKVTALTDWRRRLLVGCQPSVPRFRWILLRV